MTHRRARPRQRVRPRGGLVLAVVLSFIALSAFVVVAVVAGVSAADVAARDALLSLASPAVLAVMHVVNQGGNWPFLFPATFVLLLVSRRARARWWIWVALMIAAPLAEQAMKHLVGRPRPEASSYGFPSGHTTAAAAFFGAVIYLAGGLPPLARRLVRVAAVAAIALVGIARVMLHAHWPSDALGGAALGLALASLAAMLATAESNPTRPRTPRRA